MSCWRGGEETRILVAPDSGAIPNSVGRLLSLRHPKSASTTCYLLNDGLLRELHWFKQPYSSWFLGDYVCEDGRLYTATPVDPVFVLLPIFEEARMKKGNDPGKFRQLDEILFVNGHPEYCHLISIAENCMQLVCDTKEIGSSKFFRLDDSKVLAWLHCKEKGKSESKTKNTGKQQAKKNKVETESRNIKEMFSRVTRSKRN
ncbi:hypothetical protein Tsubulata_030546 [Turnera subulata]|uniref:Ribonuclease H2 subunit B n=1 Tax=Turnera subulata TaxID=218843 RepID=A0A9Q0J3E0_9ROSI|nr:hypothetical protein Tsubulata_030546 [Turnera subulata]